MKNPYVFLLLTVSLVGCGSGGTAETASSAADSNRIDIVCTTNIVKDLVRQIGGDHVAVDAIMDGPGVDPHTYTPSPQDTNRLRKAELVVYSGLHLEGQLDDALQSIEKFGIPVICVTDGIRVNEPNRLLGSEGTADPHVWFDPELWAACGQWVAAELSRIDSDNAESYAANATAFEESMQRTLTTGRELIDQIPADQRVLVTAHDAFAYFSRSFAFTIEPVQGISTESEPGLKRINELIDLLVTREIRAVFTEHSVSDRNISALVAGCEAKGHALKIGGRLFSDTAGAAGTPEETLSGALLYNIRQIVAALGSDTKRDRQAAAGESSP